MVEGERSPKEYIKFGLLIFGIGMLAYSVADFDGSAAFGDWMQWFMGLFFLIFGAIKLIDYEMFVEMFRLYDPWAKRWNWYAWAYPFIEIFLGMLFITNALAGFREVATIAVVLVNASGVRQQMGKHELQCACLGNVIKLPLSRVTLFEDLTMATMAFISLFI